MTQQARPSEDHTEVQLTLRCTAHQAFFNSTFEATSMFCFAHLALQRARGLKSRNVKRALYHSAQKATAAEYARGGKTQRQPPTAEVVVPSVRQGTRKTSPTHHQNTKRVECQGVFQLTFFFLTHGIDESVKASQVSATEEKCKK